MAALNKIDQFGLSFPIKVLGKEKHTSILGGCLTLIAITGSLIVFYFMGLDLWNRSNPTVVPNEVTHVDPQFVNLSDEIFPFMVNLRFFDGFNTPNKGYKLLAEYHDWRQDEKGEWKGVCLVHHETLTDCTKHSAQKLDYYKDVELVDFKCVDFKKIEAQCKKQSQDPNYEVLFGGTISDRIRRYIRLTVVNYIFNEKREVIYVSPESELYLDQQTHLHIRYPAVALNNQLVNDPLITTGNEEQHLLFKDTYKFQFKWFKMVTFLDDKGWLGESIQTTTSIEKDLETTDFFNSRVWNDERRVFFQTVIFLSHKEQQHHRRYIKLQDVLAISASFMKGIASACWLYVLWQGQKQLDNKLIEDIFNFEEKQAKANVPEIKDNSLMSTLAVAKKTKDALNPGFLACCFNSCWSKKSTKVNIEVLTSAIAFVHRKIEVTSIIRLFNEFEKTKEIVLSNEQNQEVENYRNMAII